jgi:hypothetical protein
MVVGIAYSTSGDRRYWPFMYCAFIWTSFAMMMSMWGECIWEVVVSKSCG